MGGDAYGCDDGQVALAAGIVLVYTAKTGLEHHLVLDGEAGTIVVVRLNGTTCQGDGSCEGDDRSVGWYYG
jgi:hypothetical protein